MESNFHQSQGKKLFEIFRPSQKQCTNHHLLHTVRQVNGDISFKQLCQKCLIIKFNKRMVIPQRYIQDHFSYIIQGQVYVYKAVSNQKTTNQNNSSILDPSNIKGIFITCHKGHEIFGLQEYPLNIVQVLTFQASEGTKIMVFPIEFSLTSFKKIFNMNVVQYRTELMKQAQFFKELQIQKLKKISLYSKRYQLQKGQVIPKYFIAKKFILLVITGEILCQQYDKNKIVYSKGMTIGLQQILEGQKIIKQSQWICLSDSQLMLIPKMHVIRCYNIKYKLEEKDSGSVKSKIYTQYNSSQNYKDRIIQQIAKRKVMFHSNTEQNFPKTKQIRPSTSMLKKNAIVKEIKSMTFYNPKGAITTKKYMKTEGSDRSSHEFDYCESQKIEDQNHGYRSLGEMCLRKFLTRKEKKENCEIMKYLKSNAPELKLNPSKQYALMKPLHVNNSSYIKNYKRRLRKTYLKTGEKEKKEDKKQEAKFSLFFQEQKDI